MVGAVADGDLNECVDAVGPTDLGLETDFDISYLFLDFLAPSSPANCD